MSEKTAQVRVSCALENASALISGVRFGVASSDAAGTVRVSEPLSPEQAARFLSIPGFEQCALGPEVLVAVDEEIAQHAAAASAETDTTAPWKQQVEELQRANLALSAERDALRIELAAAQKKAGPPDARVAALEREVADLRQANERLGAAAEVELPTAKTGRGPRQRGGAPAAA